MLPAPLPSEFRLKRLQRLAGVVLSVLLLAALATPVLVIALRPTEPRPPAPVLTERPAATTSQAVELPDEPRSQLMVTAALVPQPPEASEPASIAPSSRPARMVSASTSAPSDAELLARPTSGPNQSRPAPLDRSGVTRALRVKEFGGTRGTETAVEAGLAWLAAHQDRNGYWDRFDFANHCPASDRCTGAATLRPESNLTPGVTAITLLAFLGAGYTDRDGPYTRTVQSGIQYLLDVQQPSGGFGGDPSNAGYNDSVATFALAEFYGLTAESSIRSPLERAAEHLAATQQAWGGWDYTPRPDTGRNDTSITAWAVQALQAALAAGIDVNRITLAKAAIHFARATIRDGHVWYADAGNGFNLDEQTLQPRYRFGPAMLAAGLTCEQLLGWRADARGPARQAALIEAEPPSAATFQGGDQSNLHSEYYWYYGTICMFQAGGPDWERWNGRMRDALMPLQSRAPSRAGGRSHDFGSFQPYGSNWGQWGRVGSRIYSTAINVLTLEIYYRHRPMYLQSPTLTAADWRAFTAVAEPRQLQVCIGLLSDMQLEIGEPVMQDLLSANDLAVAAQAARGLTEVDSPLGLGVLEKAVQQLGPNWAAELAGALKKARELTGLPVAQGRVRLVESGRRLATVELPRAYVGMKLRVARGGSVVGEMEVVRRFSGRDVVVAAYGSDWGATAPAAGDTVQSE